MWPRGRLLSRTRKGKEAEAKLSDCFAFSEPFTRLRSHRILPLFRGEKEVLDLTFEPDEPADHEVRVASASASRTGAGGPTRG